MIINLGFFVKIKIGVVVLSLITKGLFGQPGPFGGYAMSFMLMDAVKKVITIHSEDYSVFPTYLKNKGQVRAGFGFDFKQKRFYYNFSSTPVGPDVPAEFTINIIHENDTMKIFFADSVIGDTLCFQKGRFVVQPVRVSTKPSGLSASNTGKAYEILKLERMPDHYAYEKPILKLDNGYYLVTDSTSLNESKCELLRIGAEGKIIIKLNNLEKTVDIYGIEPAIAALDQYRMIISRIAGAESQCKCEIKSSKAADQLRVKIFYYGWQDKSGDVWPDLAETLLKEGVATVSNDSFKEYKKYESIGRNKKMGIWGEK